MYTSDASIARTGQSASGGRSARFAAWDRPAASPATMNRTSSASFNAVTQPWTRAVSPRPETWTAAKARVRTVASARWTVSAVVPERLSGAVRYFEAPKADAAAGAANPIRNETQPERNATSGP